MAVVLVLVVRVLGRRRRGLLGRSLRKHLLLLLRLALAPLLCDEHDLEAPQLLKVAVPHVHLRVVPAVL